MKAIILAAGLGSRLLPLTADRPKCLVEIHGRSLLRIMYDVLQECGISSITVITGYCATGIERELGTSVAYWHYPDFATTNNLMTLNHAAYLLEGDLIILFSDVLVEPEQLRRCVGDARPFSLMIDTSACRPDTMRVRVDHQRLVDIGNHIRPECGQGNFLGIAKFSAGAAKLLREEIVRMGRNALYRNSYYTAALASLSSPENPVGVLDIAGGQWLEIDSIPDYELATQQDFYLPTRNR